MAITNYLTIDVEDYYHVAAFDDAIDRQAWSGIQSRVVANTRNVLELFSRHEVKATFFVLGFISLVLKVFKYLSYPAHF